MMALDALWPSPSPGSSPGARAGAGAGAGASPDVDDGELRWLEGPSPLVSTRALLPLHSSLTLTVLTALHRLPRLDPPPAAVLARVIAEYPGLRLAGGTSDNNNNDEEDEAIALRSPPSSSSSSPSHQQWLDPLLGGAGMLSSEPHVRLACLNALARLFGEGQSNNNPIITAAADDDTLGD